MRGAILTAVLATGLGIAASAPAQALGPVRNGAEIETPVTQVASAARQRRIYMMQQIQRQQMYGNRGYGRGPGYGRGYGGGYGGYGRGGYGGGGYDYGPPRRGYGYGGW